MDELLDTLRTSARHVRSCVHVVVVVLAITLVCGCSGSSSRPNPYEDRIKAAQKAATSAFERAVLADGRITRSEYLQAEQKYVQCLRSLGYVVTLEDPTNSGLYQMDVLSSKDDKVGITDEANITCGTGTTIIIDPLYADMVMNPENIDIYLVQLRCLQRSGLAPKSYTLAEFKSDMSKDDDAAYPFNDTDPRWVACLINPSRRWP